MAYVTKINGYDIKDSEARTNLANEITARRNADTALGNEIGDLSSLTTTNKASLVGAINEVNAKIPMINTTWSELKALRDGGNLVKGLQYRITDFVTTTAQDDTRSAGHAFDVIVTADSESVLNENARAAIHEGDTYFADSKLQAWKLKYCLDNDTERFAWADTTNGKGVIYQMVDEFDNDLPYDFKNIQFKRWGVKAYLVNFSARAASVDILNSLISSDPALRWGLPVYESAEDAIEDSGSTWYQGVSSSYTLQSSERGQWKVEGDYYLFVLSNDSSKWFYTFSSFTSDSDATTDSSLLGNVYKNKFGLRVLNFKRYLLNIVFIGTVVYNNTIGNSFFNDTIGNTFDGNTIGNYFNNNTIGNNFDSNTIGNSFDGNTIGNNFYNNTIGNSFNGNTIGNYFNNNTIGNTFDGNTIGNNFYNNTIGNNFDNNPIGNYFYNNTIGNFFNGNTIGNNFNGNTIGNSFNGNTIGNSFNGNTIGNFYRWNHFEDSCQRLNFSTDGTSSSYVQKYRVLAGTVPSSAQTVSVSTGNTIPYNIKQTGANAISVEAA